MTHRTLLAALSLMTITELAHAEDARAISNAREAARQGLEAMQAGRFEEAAAKLLGAYQIGSGDVAIQRDAQNQAETERDDLTPRIPKLTIAVVGSSTSLVAVEVDGVRVPNGLFTTGWQVNPGIAKISATVGSEHQQQQVEFSEGKTEQVTFRFEQSGHGASAMATATSGGTPAPNVSPITSKRHKSGGSTQRTAAWVGFGLGGAGLVLGGVTGLLAMSKRGQLDANGCSENQCDAAQAGAMDSYNRMRHLSTFGVIAGAAGITTGIVLWFTAPKRSSTTAMRPELTPWVGPGSAGLDGRF